MIKVVIVEDEVSSLLRLEKMITEEIREIEIVGKAGSVDKGIQVIQDEAPDLLFLDVELGNKTSFDILEKFPTPSFDVIFVTGHEDYTLEAFKVAAIDYLLKPINSDDLKKAYARFSRRKNSATNINRVTILKENKAVGDVFKKKIVINSMKRSTVLTIGEILWLESDGSYTHVYLETKKTVVSSRLLKEYEKMMIPYGFMRIHRSYLVNLDKIKSFDKLDLGYLTMNDGTKLLVSRRKRGEIVQWLNQLN